MTAGDRSGMVRIAELDGAIVLDEAGRLPGRGGYLHRAPECLSKFARSKVREFRSLKRRLAPDERRRIAEAIAVSAGQPQSARIE
jgi:predicted RNA-binding protein YlxR (DUF448 family)